jgi:hypothetical protein
VVHGVSLGSGLVKIGTFEEQEWLPLVSEGTFLLKGVKITFVFQRGLSLLENAPNRSACLSG